MKKEEAEKIIDEIKNNAKHNFDTEKKFNIFLSSTGFYHEDGQLKPERKNV